MSTESELSDLDSILARNINCLTNPKKIIRKKALEDIQIEILNYSTQVNEVNLQKVFNEITKPLLRVFNDTSENCRELVIEIVTELISRVPEPCECLPYLVPILVQRLGQSDNIVESSEEIRLLLVKLAHKLVEISGKDIGVYLDDFAKILRRTIVDPYPEVKKESCSLTSCLSKTIPEKFHLQSESLINPLLHSLTHQHSKVRICVVEAIGDVIQNGNNKCVDDVRGHLAQRLFDQSQAVRMAVIKVIGEWLLNLMDRYSFHHKLIPLLLTGLTDELQIVQMSTGFWYDIGLKFEQENEKDLKDQMDFPTSQPEIYPPNVTRPNLGCRVLVGRHLSKILPCLMNDLTDWVVTTRIQASKLLYPLLINAEEKVVQHLPLILNGMYSSCKDSEKEVIQNILKSAELLGYFVKPEVWTKLVMEEISRSPGHSTLMILSAIIKGSKQNQLKDHLVVICDKLASPDICYTTKDEVLAELIKCAKAIMNVSREDCVSVGYQLFSIFITALALSCTDNYSDIDVQAKFGLGDLALVHHMTFGASQLYVQYSCQLIEKLKGNYTEWTSTSFEVKIFETIFFNVGDEFLPMLVDDLIEVMCCCLNPNKEDQLRMKMMAMLASLLSQYISKTNEHPVRHKSLLLLRKLVIPNLIWQAGRIAKTIRFSAMSTAWSLFQSHCISENDLMEVIDELLPQLMTTLQDDYRNTRLLTCRVLIRMLEKLCDIEPPNYDMLHSIYPHLLTRLDDNEDDVRLLVTNVFQAYFDALKPYKYDCNLFQAHLKTLYQGLIIHLDDQDTKIQKAIFDVLKKAGQIDKTLLIAELERVMHKHRQQTYCKQLIEQFMHKSRK